MKFVLAVLTIMAFTFTSTSHAQEWTGDQKEVWKVVEDGWTAWQQGDLESAKTGLHEKFNGWNSKYPLPVGKAKILKYYAMMKESMDLQHYDIEPARIIVTDNAAVVFYYFEFYAIYTIGEKKIEENVKGKNAEFYVKEKGKWLLLGDMTFPETAKK